VIIARPVLLQQDLLFCLQGYNHLVMASDITVRTLDKQEFELWDRFVDESRHGSVYSHSYFLEALSIAFGRKFRILGAFRNNDLAGGLGILYSTGRFGDEISPPPLQYYNGPVIADFESKYPSVTSSRQAGIIHAIMDELESGKYALAELSNRHTLDDPRILLWRGWNIFPRYTYVIPIDDLEKQWSRIEQNLRRLISRCERQGMALELSDDADAFYTMHHDTYHRKGVKPYISREKFIALYRSLNEKNACQIYFARTADGRAAAAQVVLMSKHPVTHTWMAGSNPEFLRSGASAFLRWKAFEDLNQRRYAYNDLTDAMNETVAKFKSQLGGELVPSFVIYKEISSKLRMMKRINALLNKPMDMLRARLGRNINSTSGDE